MKTRTILPKPSSIVEQGRGYCGGTLLRRTEDDCANSLIFRHVFKSELLSDFVLEKEWVYARILYDCEMLLPAKKIVAIDATKISIDESASSQRYSYVALIFKNKKQLCKKHTTKKLGYEYRLGVQRAVITRGQSRDGLQQHSVLVVNFCAGKRNDLHPSVRYQHFLIAQNRMEVLH